MTARGRGMARRKSTGSIGKALSSGAKAYFNLGSGTKGRVSARGKAKRALRRTK